MRSNSFRTQGINDLPTETLFTVFDLAVANSNQQVQKLRVLMLICRCWALTSSNSGMLWSEITYNYGVFSLDNFKHSIFHSKGCKLIISIDDSRIPSLESLNTLYSTTPLDMVKEDLYIDHLPTFEETYNQFLEMCAIFIHHVSCMHSVELSLGHGSTLGMILHSGVQWSSLTEIMLCLT